MKNEAKYYIPDERNNIGDWTPIKMLKDVKSTYYYEDDEYFKEGNVYKGSKRNGGPWMYTFGHGAYHYFKNDEIEILDGKILDKKKRTFKIPKELVNWIDGEAIRVSKNRKQFLIDILKYGQYFYLWNKMDSMGVSKSLPQFDLDIMIEEEQVKRKVLTFKKAQDER